MKKIKKPHFTIGADPEFFLKNNMTDQFVLASFFLTDNDRNNPLNLGAGFSAHRDNVMVECNIPPATSKDEFIYNLNYVLDKIRSTVVTDRSVDFAIQPSAEFNEFDLMMYEGGLEFGCSAYLNVYGSEKKAPDSTNFRFAGGHIHIGLTSLKTANQKKEFVKILDVLLGIPALEKDKDSLRREYYGQLGNYRETDYGLEYRTLSNFWIKTPEEIGWVYDQVEQAVEMFNKGIRYSNEQVLALIKKEKTEK